MIGRLAEIGRRSGLDAQSAGGRAASGTVHAAFVLTPLQRGQGLADCDGAWSRVGAVWRIETPGPEDLGHPAGDVIVEEVILVDESDRAIGFAEKIQAHLDGGKLHRAFSIFIFDSRGRMLLQKRAAAKYHFGGLWTNACCGHPRRGEEVAEAAHRRLGEELGIEIELAEVHSFVYEATDAKSGLTEREYDHVLVGRFDGNAVPNPDEIDELKWVEVAELQDDVLANASRYTPWFAEAIPAVLRKLKS